MNYLISQINKERNRHLLAVNRTQLAVDPNADQKLWGSSSSTQGNRNPCIPKSPDGTLVPPNLSDFNISGSPPKGNLLYINEETGAITTQRGSARRAFRIFTDDSGQTFKLARNQPEFLDLLDDSKNKGIFRLTVEAIIYESSSSSKISSRALLQEDFDVIPKCCKVSFGRPRDGQQIGHGSYSYNLDLDDTDWMRDGCLSDPDRFGVALGFGGSKAPLKITGGALIQNKENIPIKDILCIDSTGTCSQSGEQFNNEVVNQVVPVDLKPPAPPPFPGSWGTGSPPVLNPCSASKCLSNLNTNQVAKANQQLTYYDSDFGTIFDATNVDEAKLPANCIITKTDLISGDQREELHCAFSSIELKGKIRFITGIYGEAGPSGRLLRLYFPVGGNVVKKTGNGAIDHRKIDPTTGELKTPERYTDLSWFGCTSCGPQSLDMQGTASSINMSIYMPLAQVALAGDSKYEGVLWTNTVSIQGNAYPIVPASGVAEVFILLGILPDEDGTFANSITGRAETDFLPFDMIARSSNRFRFIGN